MPVAIARPGPWTHRDLTAGGTRFHAALAGPEDSDFLVLLLHPFPECWWAWRHVIPRLAEAGHRVAALDLRGFGGSDRPPSGYDLHTLADDAVRVVAALGHERAAVVGAGLGGQVAWVMAGMRSDLVAGIVPVAAPHPVAVRSLLGRAFFSGTALQHLSLRVPGLAERTLTTHRGMERVLRSWVGQGRVGRVLASSDYYADLLARPGAARGPIETLKRSRLRRAEMTALAAPIAVPVLSILGESDPVQPAQAHARDTHHVSGLMRTAVLHGVGHFPAEEAPDELVEAILPFLAEVAPAA
ncbi:alpha/beta fold hydrolase [Actinomyces sp. zg328]|uniref:alpha/beta fold hydrolase n=1 Tax=Actinomyces sp. zg328 TaxID=2609287 RepID=UPI00135981D0|nr:alpha/beta hydrolase [Actinomyces sp. zg328]